MVLEGSIQYEEARGKGLQEYLMGKGIIRERRGQLVQAGTDHAS